MVEVVARLVRLASPVLGLVPGVIRPIPPVALLVPPMIGLVRRAIRLVPPVVRLVPGLVRPVPPVLGLVAGRGRMNAWAPSTSTCRRGAGGRARRGRCAMLALGGALAVFVGYVWVTTT
jgi:hypothetical protein